MENDEIASCGRDVVLVAQRGGQALDQAKEPVTSGRNMCAVLDVTRRPEALGGSVVALVEEDIKRVEDGLDAAAILILLFETRAILRSSRQAADDRGPAGKLDPIAVRIQNHRYPCH